MKWTLISFPASTPYGLPSAQELLRVLVNLLDPNDQQHTDSIRFAILGILINGLEASGSRIVEFPSLRNMLLDQGCKYLFQIARSENVNVLRLALRAITSLLGTMQGQLKLQTELFLSFAMDRLAPPITILPPKVQLSIKTGGHDRKNVSQPGTPRPDTPLSGDSAVDSLIPEEFSQGEQTPPASRRTVMPAKGLTRELMLETVGFIGRRSTFMVDLWVNYDCDVNCEDIFERLIGFITRVRGTSVIRRDATHSRDVRVFTLLNTQVG
jgi:brefeldin A-resistance guanine nucleotide exchange factor 1